MKKLSENIWEFFVFLQNFILFMRTNMMTKGDIDHFIIVLQ